MVENRYFELVRRASNNVSEFTNRKERWNEYEATWKALLFHELIQIDENVKDSISMENQAYTTNKKTWGKKFDMWLGDSFVLEVKLVWYRKQVRKDGLRKMNSKTGVRGDLKKLRDFIDSKKGSVKGIAIAVNAKRGNVTPEEIIKLVDGKLIKMLSGDLKLLVCSNGKCEYASAGGQ